MLHSKYQGSMPCGLDKKILLCFPSISLCKIFDPQFWPQGHNLIKLGRGLLDDATYHIKALCLMVLDKGFILEIFF